MIQNIHFSLLIALSMKSEDLGFSADYSGSWLSESHELLLEQDEEQEPLECDSHSILA